MLSREDSLLLDCVACLNGMDGEEVASPELGGRWSAVRAEEVLGMGAAAKQELLIACASLLLDIEWTPGSLDCPECERFHPVTAVGGEVDCCHRDGCRLGCLCERLRAAELSGDG